MGTPRVWEWTALLASARGLSSGTHLRLRKSSSGVLLTPASSQIRSSGCASDAHAVKAPGSPAFAFTSLSWWWCCAQPPADSAGVNAPGPQGGWPSVIATSKTLMV